MQRVASDVREYELVCSNVMLGLGVPYRSLPPELLDAITHDPSSVTSGTRKRRGWTAVEDIHERVLRQREIIRIFLSTMKVDDVPAPDNVLDKPISTLMERLQALEREREPLQTQANNVTEILTQVRAVHATVKEEYNEAVSYTSLVYPEVITYQYLHINKLTRYICSCRALSHWKKATNISISKSGNLVWMR
jgi:predicted GTPase